MLRIWPLLLALIASGCTNASQDFTDAPSTPDDESTRASTVPQPPAPSTVERASQPVADPDSDVPTPVPAADIDQLFADFVESPDRGAYLAVRRQVVASHAYQPYSDEFTTAEEFLDLYRLDEARAALEETLPNLLLSPRAHRLLAEIESADNDVQAADRERRIADACVAGILATGDGSEQQPWLVLRTSDEYDVLAHLGKRPEMQSLVRGDGKSFDLISCTDDSEVWFDVTDAFEQLGKSLGQ
jgi:hypothetical protein